MKLLRMTDTDLRNKRVLIREDLNVPVQDGVVTSDARIRASLATIRYALDQDARVFIVSHLGRPQEGQEDPALTLAPVAARLSGLLGKPVPLRKNWIDGVDCPTGSAVLCENVRFLRGEKQDDEQLARRMASLCEVFVMDAFGTAHRAEASTHGVARHAPVACAGPVLVGELEALERALKQPARPLMAIVGGSKVSTKLLVLEALLERVDNLIVGGGIANTFLAATGVDVGKSLYEAEMLDVARRLLDKARSRGAQIPLPTDVVVANLPYLPESAHDPLYDGEPPEAVYAPGDGLDPYRRLLNACREGRLVTPGGKVVLQYHREPLTADCWQLEDLRMELEEKQLAAA